ncbi:MAG: hypothetical protein R2792_17040 [Saprospiraceae bacterium]
MSQELLDNPNEWKKNSSRSVVLIWWMHGLVMGVALLLANLLREQGYLGVFFDEEIVFLATVIGVYVAGPLILGRNLDQSRSEIAFWKYGLYGASSGLLATGIFIYLKMIGPFAFLNEYSGLVLGCILGLGAAFSGLVCLARPVFLQKKNLGIWIGLVVLWLLFSLLFLGMPNGI